MSISSRHDVKMTLFGRCSTSKRFKKVVLTSYAMLPTQRHKNTCKGLDEMPILITLSSLFSYFAKFLRNWTHFHFRLFIQWWPWKWS